MSCVRSRAASHPVRITVKCDLISDPFPGNKVVPLDERCSWSNLAVGIIKTFIQLRDIGYYDKSLVSACMQLAWWGMLGVAPLPLFCGGKSGDWVKAGLIGGSAQRRTHRSWRPVLPSDFWGHAPDTGNTKLARWARDPRPSELGILCLTAGGSEFHRTTQQKTAFLCPKWLPLGSPDHPLLVLSG